MRGRRLAGVAGLLILLAGVGPANAMTSDGTMITSVACITHSSPSGYGFTVSFCVTARVFISNPCLTGQKTANPSAMESGGVMTYTIWVVNCSCTGSAFNINVTDRLPDNVVMGFNMAGWNGGSGGAWFVSSGSNNTTWAVNAPLSGQAPPYFLRYVLDQLGPCRSAYSAFTVTLQ
ncbi:MAG: hypothetical protein AAB152_18655 [Candidatus Coatesbacteria bacterium]